MTNPLNIMFWLLQAVILVFVCLALGVARRQRREHLAWLIPLAVGQALGLIGNIVGAVLPYYAMSRSGYYPSQVSWFLIPVQIVYVFSILGHLWFAIALYVTLRSQVFINRQAP